MNRITFVVAGIAALAAGCKTPDDSGGTTGAGNFVTAGDNVVVKSVRVYSDAANSVQGDTVYIVTFTFTNQLGLDLVPQLNHFVLEDQQKIRHSALQGGFEQLAGISNDLSPIKQGASRDFTLGFQVYLNTTGTLFYDPT